MPEVASCSKCSGDMERGFILDNAGGVGLPDRWMKGPLESSIWGGAKVFRKVKLVVETYRCVQCGFLESYAITEFNKQWLQKMATE